MKIILQGVSTSLDHPDNALLTVKIAEKYLESSLSPDVINKIMDENRFAYGRALDASKSSNFKRWSNIKPGDVAITHGRKRVLFVGTVAHVINAPEMHNLMQSSEFDALRGRKPKQGIERYELTYFLKNVVPLSLPKDKLMVSLNYSEKFSGQGLRFVENPQAVHNALAFINYDPDSADLKYFSEKTK